MDQPLIEGIGGVGTELGTVLFAKHAAIRRDLANKVRNWTPQNLEG